MQTCFLGFGPFWQGTPVVSYTGPWGLGNDSFKVPKSPTPFLVKEYTLNHNIKAPVMKGILLN